MKKGDKVFIIGITSLFIAMISVLLGGGKIIDPEKFRWMTGDINILIISGGIFFLGISIFMFIKFIKLN